MNCVNGENYSVSWINTYARQTTAQSGAVGAQKATEYVNKSEDGSRGKTQKESAVKDFIRKHPDAASHVKAQVRDGKAVLSRNGADRISREDMTMEEYRCFITALMDSIPFDASQRNSTEIWSISDRGWEQMKNDPDYEAWVLGYTVENRSVHFPFGLAEMKHLCTEKFGASIEEHIGQSIPTGDLDLGGSGEDEEETWWQKRHRKHKELLRDQVKAAQARDQASRRLAVKLSLQTAYESRQRMSSFLNGEETSFQSRTEGGMKLNMEMAAAYYEQNIMELPMMGQ